MKMFLRIAVAVVVTLGIAGCILIPDPTTKKVESEFVGGIRSETGEQLVGRTWFRPYLYSLTPIGKLDGNSWTEYSLIRGGAERRLAFLDENFRRDDPANNPFLLHEFFPLRGTSRWAGFKITRMARGDVDLLLIDFDAERVRGTARIDHAIRHLGPNAGLANFSTALDPVSGLVTVTTEAGVFVYDPTSNRFIPQKPNPSSITPQSNADRASPPAS